MFASLAIRAVGVSSSRVASRSSAIARRHFASAEPTLKQRVTALIPEEQKKIKALKEKYNETVIGTCTVDQAYGGMRSVLSMIYETSLLDPEEGIRFRGYSIPECQKLLPTAEGGHEPLPEGLLWLLLTGEIPTKSQVKELSAELARRSKLPASAINVIDSLPKNMHSMTQFATGVLALQPDSHFFAAYHNGTANKKNYWDFTFEDSLDLIAKLPAVASRIYRNLYFDGKHIAADNNLDWAANFAHMLGNPSEPFKDLMRLYLTIHSDHEGGNVSAHATHLVGSALSDPYLSFAGGMTGLAGPLHGLANQEVLSWTLALREKMGNRAVTNEELEQALWDTLNAGHVVPGFGHAVLRKTDPRYMCQREFSLKHLPNDPLFQLVSQIFEVAPKVLTKHGKTKNPWPNVDAHSGVVLMHYGFQQHEFYTVLFGVSRALGVLSQLVWDRALNFPLERPKSIDTRTLAKELEAGKYNRK